MKFEHSSISEGAYRGLVELMGQEKAEEFIMSVQYNYKAIMMKILTIQLQKFYYANQKLILLFFGLFCMCYFLKEFIERFGQR